jgi:hypothetical protein
MNRYEEYVSERKLSQTPTWHQFIVKKKKNHENKER